MLRDDISAKILLDNYDGYIHSQIEKINRNSENMLIQLECSNRLGEFNEMIICFDGKYILEIHKSLTTT